MTSMLKVQIIGYVGKDPEMRYTGSGQAVTSFSVAHSDQYTNAAGEKVKKTIWVRVSTWGKLAENCKAYVTKGMLVHVEGKLVGDENGNPKIYTKTDGSAGSNFEMTAFSVLFLSGNNKVQGEATGEAIPADEDLPF